ncbi:hypothetical protein LINPERPRIM_LOCUS6867, partial [Linum perenne]
CIDSHDIRLDDSLHCPSYSLLHPSFIKHPSPQKLSCSLCLGFLPCFQCWFLFTVIYGVFYICLDKKAGSLAALLLAFCLLASSFLGSWLCFSLTWKVRKIGNE